MISRPIIEKKNKKKQQQQKKRKLSLYTGNDFCTFLLLSYFLSIALENHDPSLIIRQRKLPWSVRRKYHYGYNYKAKNQSDSCNLLYTFKSFFFLQQF